MPPHTFLPTDYSIPSNSLYFTLKNGANKFRILGSAVVGWEYWTKESVPVRTKTPPKATPADIRMDKDKKTGLEKPSRIKHFWIFPVWNFEEGRVQIFEVTQSTIQEGIKALVDNDEWGDPKSYNIVVTRSGEGFDTTYVVQPSPKSALTPEMTKELEASNLNLENIFEGKDMFGGKTAEVIG